MSKRASSDRYEWLLRLSVRKFPFREQTPRRIRGGGSFYGFNIDEVYDYFDVLCVGILYWMSFRNYAIALIVYYLYNILAAVKDLYIC